MKTLRAIVAGIIFLVLPISTLAEAVDRANVAELTASLDKEMANLKALDTSARPLAEDKKVIDQKLMAYGYYHEVWYGQNAALQEEFRKVKQARIHFTSTCQNTPSSNACIYYKKIMGAYSYYEAKEEYDQLGKLKQELDLQKEELMGKLGTREIPGTVGLLGENSVAGWEYLLKRRVIVAKIRVLQTRRSEIQKGYTPEQIPPPGWTLWEGHD